LEENTPHGALRRLGAELASIPIHVGHSVSNAVKSFVSLPAYGISVEYLFVRTVSLMRCGMEERMDEGSMIGRCWCVLSPNLSSFLYSIVRIIVP
jgi:hypothetical protein